MESFEEEIVKIRDKTLAESAHKVYEYLKEMEKSYEIEDSKLECKRHLYSGNVLFRPKHLENAFQAVVQWKCTENLCIAKLTYPFLGKLDATLICATTPQYIKDVVELLVDAARKIRIKE